MGKKKKARLSKVWCFYCEREFEDEKILIQHQKAKHFKCHVCHKKLSTAGGMVVHVLQVHKESITKVPNAKRERESAELEIFGMEGIPPDILAAHDGDEEDEKPVKVARVDISASSPFGVSLNLGSHMVVPQQQSYSTIPSVTLPVMGGPHLPSWPVPPSTQGWTMRPPQQNMMPPLPHPARLPQPLFPIHASQPPPPPPSIPPVQPLFPIRPPPVAASAPGTVPQPLGFAKGLPNHASSGFSSSAAVLPAHNGSPFVDAAALSRGAGSGDGDFLIAAGSLQEGGQMVGGAQPGLGGRSLVPPPATHMYASAPSTAGPSIGPPPVISNKPPGPPGSSGMLNEVYLVWDDEVLSMEEQRLFLTKYQVPQVLDETTQMNSIDAAFDRRIMEGRLANRMGFRV